MSIMFSRNKSIVQWKVIYMANHFRAADVLLPRECDYDKWAVIACDQHTSEPEYWDFVRKKIGDAPSTLDMFFPEADLNMISDEHLETFSNNMRDYLSCDFFKSYPQSYVYVERTLFNGQIRQGIVGVIDLEFYDYAPKPSTKIYATEATVLQRVPPRIALRKTADLEFSHVVMFCDDKNHTLIEPVASMRDKLEKVYDFDLMTNGGHITGYMLPRADAAEFEQAISSYEAEHPYLIGDGNHSLVTAKLTYEAMKEANPEINWEEHPARYAMVELENIHSDAMVFEPIYRIAMCENPKDLIDGFINLDDKAGIPVTWIHGAQEECVRLQITEGDLPIEALQRFLDRWMETNSGSVDYIHGCETVRNLAQEPDTVGFLLPELDKSILFPYILSGKVMPQKTFSIGRAEEKRYYLEGRKIK